MVRIVNDPFGIKESLVEIRDADEVPIGSQQALVEGFQKRYLISADPPAEPVIAWSPIPFRETDEDAFRQVEDALRKTRNNSSPGPDRIPYRLIKLIQGTDLGRSLLYNIGRTTQGQALA